MIQFKSAFIKGFTTKIGKAEHALTFSAPLDWDLAAELGIHEDCFTKEQAPKRHLQECKLDIDITDDERFDVRLAVVGLPDVLHVSSSSIAKGWVAKKEEGGWMIEFRICFGGAAASVVDWLDKYGEIPGSLTLKRDGPVQQEMHEPTPRPRMAVIKRTA
jgi:hypothetical protein